MMRRCRVLFRFRLRDRQNASFQRRCGRRSEEGKYYRGTPTRDEIEKREQTGRGGKGLQRERADDRGKDVVVLCNGLRIWTKRSQLSERQREKKAKMRKGGWRDGDEFTIDIYDVHSIRLQPDYSTILTMYPASPCSIYCSSSW